MKRYKLDNLIGPSASVMTALSSAMRVDPQGEWVKWEEHGDIIDNVCKYHENQIRTLKDEIRKLKIMEEGAKNKGGSHSVSVGWGRYALYDITFEHHCIALGDGAQANESYQFTFVANGQQYTAIMTQEEYDSLYGLLKRVKVRDVTECNCKEYATAMQHGGKCEIRGKDAFLITSWICPKHGYKKG